MCVNRYSQRVYNVKSTLLIKEQQTSGAVANMEQIFAGDIYNPYPNLEDEVAILTSYTLNRRVIEELPEHHIAYLPVARHGIQWQRTYGTSPFVLRKLDENQPEGRVMAVRFTGPESYRIQLGNDNKRNKRDEGREFKVGEVYNLHGFNFVLELRDSTKSS